MSDTNVAPGGGEGAPTPAIVSTPAPETSAPLTASAAASALSQRRWEKARQSQAAPVAEAPPEPAVSEAPQELAEEANADQPQADPGEPEAADPVEETQPPIEPPRSWTKEEKARFQTLPRETQEYLSQREQERDVAIRRSQNEAAEKLKGLTAKEQMVEKARQEYEAKLPALMQHIQEQQAGQFADVRTQADVDRMAQEDPFRYIQWTAHQQKVSAVQNEMRLAQERQSQEWNSKWSEFASREDKLTSERIPELADPAQRAKVQEGAISYLKDIGFEESELGSAWNGQASLSLRDHRVQSMIRDAVKFREGKAAVKIAVSTKPLPPVQRPGVAAPRGADSNIQNLSKKLETTGRIEDAAAVVAARRAAARR